MAAKSWDLTVPADNRLNQDIPGDVRDIKRHTDVAAGFYTEAQSTPDQTVAIYAGVVYFGTTKVEYAGNDDVDLGTGGTYEVSALTANYYNKVLITLNSGGALNSYEGTEASAAGSVVEPSIPNDEFPICMITVQDDGTGTAGTIEAIEQSEIAQIQGMMAQVADALLGSNNLSDLDSVSTAKSNLGFSYSSSTKTTNYSITTSDAAVNRESVTTIILSGASTNSTFTLPSVGSSEDGYYFEVLNDTDYKLTLAVSDSDAIWNSGAGYGIDIPYRGTRVLVRYDHSRTKFDIIEKTGGLIMIEGLVAERWAIGRVDGISAITVEVT